MTKKKAALLMLEDGFFSKGWSFGSAREAYGEVIFNTGLTGYQEVISDPSYTGQILVMTYPHIGNYGINRQDYESSQIYLNGIVVKEYVRNESNWRSSKTLETFMKEHEIPGIEGIDTQALVEHIRENGAMRGIITTRVSENLQTIIDGILTTPSMQGLDLVSKVTTNRAYVYHSTRTRKTVTPFFTVVLVDYGTKKNIPEMLSELGCRVVVVPACTSAEKILKYRPNGIVLSNGPGDPDVVHYAVDTLRDLMKKKQNLPIFGICMGHQILGVALGGKTYKLPFGHHGLNHPVKNLLTGKIEISSQNHGFCLSEDSLPHDVMITHKNLNDNTCEGIAHRSKPYFSVQYHPESYPGPHDSHYLFNQFITFMKNNLP